MRRALMSTMDETSKLERLTARERHVVELLAMGATVDEVAAALAIAKKTVSSHRGAALLKLGVRNNAALAREAIRLGLVLPP